MRSCGLFGREPWTMRLLQYSTNLSIEVHTYHFFLNFWRNKSINSEYLTYLCSNYLRMTDLKDTFKTEKGEGYSRRGLLRLGGLTAAAAMFAALPGGGGAEASEQNSLEMRDEMDAYSLDPSHQGIGLFINLQAGATLEQGQKLGDNMKRAFASRGVPVEYRLNQSRGTATDLTFYVKGVDFTIGLPDLKRDLRNVLAHHGDVWPRRTSALTKLDQ